MPKLNRLIEVAILAQRNEALDSFFYFVKTFWKTIIQEDPVWNWHIEFLCDELQEVSYNILDRKEKLHDLLINIPPGTTKSTIVTIMWPAWLWAKDPSIRIISNSYAGSIATDHASKSKDVISSERYKRLFPEVAIRKDMSGKKAYATTRGGERHTASTGGAVTGRHAHVIINDDPQNPKQAESDAHRKQAVEHTKTLSSRKVDDSNTVTVTVMQRLNQMDVSGYLLSIHGHNLRHIKLPAMITEKTVPEPPTLQEFYVDGLLDPLRLGRKQIEEHRILLGTRGFNGQMLQNPTAEGGDIIKEEWFERISKHSFLDLLSNHKNVPIQYFLDTSYTDRTENDPNGIISTYYINDSIYIYHAEKAHKTFPDLIEWVKEYVKRNNYTRKSMIRIEPKASGLSLIQTLKRETGLNITKTEVPKDSKTARTHNIAAVVESRRVVLVEGGWNNDFIEEVSGFPNAAHDEYVDVLVYAVNHYTNRPKITISGNVL